MAICRIYLQNSFPSGIPFWLRYAS
jgi:hypothetical protein